MKNKIKIGFFGTPEYSVITLNKLIESGFEIAFVVTMPDKPQGRKMIVTPPPIKVCALKHRIDVYQNENLNDQNFIETLRGYYCDIFVIIAYGRIIPNKVLNIPKHKSINIHGSLLPKLRGSSPIETAILNDEKDTGVTLIRMDSEMDHGPIIASKVIQISPWPPTSEYLGNEIVKTGSDLLVSILPDWVSGKIKEVEQDHSQATYTKKIEKEDGLIDFRDNPYKNYLKIQAYHGWPSAYFFVERNDKSTRVKITQASYKDGVLKIEKVIPEGKKEIDYKDLII